jgi:long-chain acyl-CoA synthetase
MVLIHIENNIVEILNRSFEQFADMKAYTCMGQHLSYSELDELSDHFAAWLVARADLEPGARVAIQLPNLLQYPVVVIGILKADMVVVNINPLYSATEVEHQLSDVGAKVMIVLASTAANSAKIIRNTSVQAVIVTELADLHSVVNRTAINWYARYFKKGRREFSFPLQFSFRQVLKAGKAEIVKGLSVASATKSPDKLAVLQYTGGTTGISKGAMLTHKNLLSNMLQLKHQLGEDCPASGSLLVAPLPLYHIYAFTTNILFALHKGHHNILIPDPRDIKGFIKTLKPLQITGFIGINTLYEALCADEAFSSLDFSNLTISSSAGMALSSKVADRWFEITGIRILEGYGLTETSPIISCGNYRDYKKGSAGKICLETEIRMLDSEGQEVARNEVGEIYVRGPQVMQAYWQQPEETSNVLDSDGWLRTGDIGRLDEEGYLYIVDRIKDIIIVSGFNVFPNEIEDCICKHPDIKEAVAIGFIEGEVSEKIKLFVVSNNPDLKSEDIIKHCRKDLAAYKVPKIVEFRDDLPKSAVGKLLRRELR